MSMAEEYPGTAEHQVLLEAVVFIYAHDPRILAVALFGSLTRGNWDQYSDLDMDIVLADGVAVDIDAEVAQLRKFLAAIGQQVVIATSNGHDAVDLILASLIGISIRYHPLEATSPNIVDSVRVLAGQIDVTAIKAAGLANRPGARLFPEILDAATRAALAVDIALQRRQIWLAIEMEQRLRSLLMELLARAYGKSRAVRVFQERADAALQTRFGATLPRYDLRSAQRAFLQLLYILEHNLDTLTGQQAQLTDAQREVLTLIRLRQANLHLDKPEQPRE
jgi:predicted nucleotidyltransferase